MQQQTQQNQQNQQPKQTKKRWKAADYHIRGNNLIVGGILAISLIILQAFIQIGLHNLWSYIVIIALAITVPCMAAIILINSHEVKYPYTSSGTIRNIIFGTGVFGSFIGILATFCYISWFVGIIFLGASMLVFVLSILYVKQLSWDEDGQYKWR